MIMKEENGFAIVLAWPETYCKQPGAWYDRFMKWLGLNKNGYYKAGHAAVVLVSADDGSCRYFDFGRYHAPFGHGRVRSGYTDPELTIHQKAEIIDGTIKNLGTILKELVNNEACHGTGNLWASVMRGSYNSFLSKAVQLQKASPIAYGPFLPKGNNCSRFVRQVLLAGAVSHWDRIRLTFPYSVSPTPAANVRAIGKPVITKGRFTTMILENKVPNHTLPEPEKHVSLPGQCQWHSGEGAGSWFNIVEISPLYLISRYSDKGSLEFRGFYRLSAGEFDMDGSFQVSYLSHYRHILIKQSGQFIDFSLVTKEAGLVLEKKSNLQPWN